MFSDDRNVVVGGIGGGGEGNESRLEKVVQSIITHSIALFTLSQSSS